MQRNKKANRAGMDSYSLMGKPLGVNAKVTDVNAMFRITVGTINEAYGNGL